MKESFTKEAGDAGKYMRCENDIYKTKENI